MPDDDDFATELRGEMNITEGRDPWSMIAVAVSIVLNLLGIAWIGGKFDARMTSIEASVSKLEAKADKDSQQDVQIATISVQLANIQTGVGEIKAKLERNR